MSKGHHFASTTPDIASSLSLQTPSRMQSILQSILLGVARTACLESLVAVQTHSCDDFIVFILLIFIMAATLFNSSPLPNITLSTCKVYAFEQKGLQNLLRVGGTLLCA